MKYITNTWSHKMFIEPHLTFDRWEMTENEFMNEMQNEEDDLIIHRVGANDIARKLGIECNKEPIQARAGDVILDAICNKGYLKYYYVLVTENEKPKPFKTDDVEETLY